MDHFRIYSDDNPQPVIEEAHYAYDEGNWRYQGVNHNVLAFQDEGEPVDVQVAIKHRVAITELEDDEPFTILQGVFA